jgi:hypothetical protein
MYHDSSPSLSSPASYRQALLIALDGAVEHKLLSERDRLILHLRLGLVDGHISTCANIARQLEISPGRVLQIQNRAMNTLRMNPATYQPLKNYLEAVPLSKKHHQRPPWLTRERVLTPLRFRSVRTENQEGR